MFGVDCDVVFLVDVWVVVVQPGVVASAFHFPPSRL